MELKKNVPMTRIKSHYILGYIIAKTYNPLHSAGFHATIDVLRLMFYFMTLSIHKTT